MDGPERLKAWRKAEGISQEKAAEIIGVHQNTWSDWEGGRKSPRTDTALEIDVLTKGACPVEAWAEENTATEWREQRRSRSEETAAAFSSAETHAVSESAQP